MPRHGRAFCFASISLRSKQSKVRAREAPTAVKKARKINFYRAYEQHAK